MLYFQNNLIFFSTFDRFCSSFTAVTASLYKRIDGANASSSTHVLVPYQVLLIIAKSFTVFGDGGVA